ncbi:MAG: methionyl-tRNA formyltransferase [Candidatus Omnitrophota bacterium]
MKIGFFGSAEFAVPSLEAILNSGHKVISVITQPDRKKGRGLCVSETAVKKAALGAGLPIYQPADVNSSQAVSRLKDLKPDLFVVAAYGQILSQEVLDIPSLMPVNVHASMLPKYRGAGPINWAIINGDKESGVTIIKMSKEMDAGPIILSKGIDIGQEDDAVTLEDRLARSGADLLPVALKLIEDKAYNLKIQDEAGVTFAPKLKKEDGCIDWIKSAFDIHNLVRGCILWPGAFTYYRGQMLKIYKTRILPLSSPGQGGISGRIIRVSKDGIAVAAGEGFLVIEELQVEGKRRMPAYEFISGHKINVNEVLGKK